MKTQELELTPEQLQELAKIVTEIEAEAIQMVKDYETNPSQESGSIVHVHHSSSLLENEEETLDDIALVSSSELLTKEYKKQQENNDD
ncbi:hypothetical protein HOB87_07140 [Candidatus Woesearchaeota archaeon]|nr:hypothetical protein [Candidatus Woesearchaeota archaeon]